MEQSVENALEIAVIKEQIKGIREQQSTHAKDTRERFDYVDEKLEVLVATLNKGKGAYAVLFLVSGLIGAATIKAAGVVLHAIGKL
jgi:hypothetical protein